MGFLKSIGIALVIVVGVYLAVILSYLLVPMTVFGVVLGVVHTLRTTGTDSPHSS